METSRCVVLLVKAMWKSIVEEYGGMKMKFLNLENKELKQAIEDGYKAFQRKENRTFNFQGKEVQVKKGKKMDFVRMDAGIPVRVMMFPRRDASARVILELGLTADEQDISGIRSSNARVEGMVKLDRRGEVCIFFFDPKNDAREQERARIVADIHKGNQWLTTKDADKAEAMKLLSKEEAEEMRERINATNELKAGKHD